MAQIFEVEPVWGDLPGHTEYWMCPRCGHSEPVQIFFWDSFGCNCPENCPEEVIWNATDLPDGKLLVFDETCLVPGEVLRFVENRYWVCECGFVYYRYYRDVHEKCDKDWTGRRVHPDGTLLVWDEIDGK